MEGPRWAACQPCWYFKQVGGEHNFVGPVRRSSIGQTQIPPPNPRSGFPSFQWATKSGRDKPPGAAGRKHNLGHAPKKSGLLVGLSGATWVAPVPFRPPYLWPADCRALVCASRRCCRGTGLARAWSAADRGRVAGRRDFVIFWGVFSNKKARVGVLFWRWFCAGE